MLMQDTEQAVKHWEHWKKITVTVTFPTSASILITSRKGFTYDKENDRYTCSRGVHLPFLKEILYSDDADQQFR